jgi:hypothetical protein
VTDVIPGLIKSVGQRVDVPSGWQAEPPAPRVHMLRRRHRPRPVPRIPLSWDVGSSILDAAAIPTLRANLHELAAEFHELAASLHDLRAEEHDLGDPNVHRLWGDLRRAAAVAERTSVQKERRAAEYWRRQADAAGHLSG